MPLQLGCKLERTPDKNGHRWAYRGTAICPHICVECGALSGTRDASNKCSHEKKSLAEAIREPAWRSSQPPVRPPANIPKTKADIEKIREDIRDILVLELRGSKLGEHVFRACEKLIDDPRFISQPASTTKHHCHAGGLAKHTLEALRLVIGMANNCPPEHAPDRLVLIYATVYHDAGKMIDYEKLSEKDARKNPRAVDDWWFSSNHNLIGHLVASHKIMCENMIPWSKERQELAEHCVLAHHGRQEWGSPVSPAAIEAWMLHLSDMMSSRFEDPTEARRKSR